jgi:purine-binding chemotaxis protein CheW
MSKLPAVVSTISEDSSGLIQLVTFRLENEEYGVEVLKVREIIRMVSITIMPNTPSYVEGIINLRGKVVPVISMRKQFGLHDSAHSSHTRIIIMDVIGEMIGFTVDAVSEVIRVPARDIQPSPAIAAGGAGQEYITGVINHGEKLLVLLDLDLMFSKEEREALFS